MSKFDISVLNTTKLSSPLFINNITAVIRLESLLFKQYQQILQIKILFFTFQVLFYFILLKIVDTFEMDFFNDIFGKKPTLKGKNQSIFITLRKFAFTLIEVISCYESSLPLKWQNNQFSEQQRENDRALRKAGRDIERERRKLEDEEKKIVIIIHVMVD